MAVWTFAKSASGQAMVRNTPELMRQSAAMAQQHLPAVAPKIQQLTKEFITEAVSGNEKQEN
jgi:hypothetical protein